MEEQINDLRQFRKRILTFSDVTGITGGGRSTGKIETRKTIHGLAFVCTDGGVEETRAHIIADIDTIIIRADGIVLRELTATQILDLYKHYHDDKVAYTSRGVILIEFAQSAFDLAQMNNEFAIGMLRNGKPMSLTYEVNYQAAVTTIDRIQVQAVVDDREREFGLHTRITQHTRSFASTGAQDITDLPKGDGTSSLLAYHFVLGNGVISKITVKEGSDEVYSNTPSALVDLMLNNSGRKLQSGYFHVPFNLDNDPRSVQPLGPNTAHWLVQPYWSTTPNGSYTIIEERVHSQL